jgi:hypothetical protein
MFHNRLTENISYGRSQFVRLKVKGEILRERLSTSTIGIEESSERRIPSTLLNSLTWRLFLSHPLVFDPQV